MTVKTTEIAENFSSKAIAKRLALIADQHSQSEIARRTNTPVSNVNRYMRGSRIPSEFFGALVKGMGLNPSWLLAGEGTRYLADVQASTGDSSTNLLELVQAMNAVTKLKLGALAGKEHQKVLRNLNDSLVIFEGQRESLIGQIRPLLRRLLKDAEESLARQKLDKADQLLTYAGELLSLCDDKEFVLRALKCEVRLESLRWNIDAAYRVHQRLFRLQFTDRALSGDELVQAAMEFVHTLQAVGRLAEASRAIDAVRILVDKSCSKELRHTLNFTSGEIDIYRGDLVDGLQKMLESYNYLEKAERSDAQPRIKRAILFSGASTVEERVDADARIYTRSDPETKAHIANHLLMFATVMEKKEGLAKACKAFIKTKAKPEQQLARPILVLHAHYVLKALDGGGKRAFDEFMSSPLATSGQNRPNILSRFFLPAVVGQVARLCGQKAVALKQVEAGEEVLAATPPEVRHRLLQLAMHYRNVMELIPRNTRSKAKQQTRARAQAFFDEHFANGFGCFKELASE